ncbi:GNAT family N-acetyltransferase [Oryzifoliimicrobium ureilyticus]|uniref:GNAT family N-acetyltransferase n=1 Tax=Oryzifoliimicrobium ureilyticus TaxID=3113724 RepID=UPI00307614FE
MAYFVRTASERDVEAIRRVLRETWHATYDAIYGPQKVQALTSVWHQASAIRRSIESKSGEFLVADDGRRLGGVAYAAMSEKMAKTAILHQLYVLPSCQRQGIGRDLFAELESCFPDAEIMRLEVAEQNAAAVSFYLTHGFTEVDRVKDADLAELLIMEKPLNRRHG